MSQSQISDDEDNDCPLCLEEIDISDKYFKPCPCGYQLCRFCWNHIKEDLNGLCPACRRKYNDDDIEFKPVPPEELVRIKNAKKRKERERKEMDMQQRKQLANVRVVQKNLVYVLGLPLKLATEETLRSHDYFGQYGKITKVVVNKRTPTAAPNTHASSPATSHTGVYITYAKKEDAARAIEAVDGTNFEGKIIRATFGTTKYCSYYLKGQPCQNVGCQFLHESGEDAEAYLKDEAKFQRDRGKQIAFAPINRKEDDAPAGLPPTANWAKTVSMNSRNFPSLSQTTSDANYEFDSSSERDMQEPQEVVPVNDENYPMLEPEKPEAKPEAAKKVKRQKQEEILGSASLSEDPNEFRFNPISEFRFGYGLVPRYNGLFDPFGGDKLRNAVLSNLKKSDTFAKSSPPGAFPPRMAGNVSGGVAMRQEESNGSSSSQNRKSRYERLFDGNAPAETYQPAAADNERWNEATSRGRPTSNNQTYHNPSMYPAQAQQQEYLKMQYQQQMMQNQRMNQDIYGVRRDLQEPWGYVGQRSSLNLPNDKPFYYPNVFNQFIPSLIQPQQFQSPTVSNTLFAASLNTSPFGLHSFQIATGSFFSNSPQFSSPPSSIDYGTEYVSDNVPAPGLVKASSNESLLSSRNSMEMLKNSQFPTKSNPNSRNRTVSESGHSEKSATSLKVQPMDLKEYAAQTVSNSATGKQASVAPIPPAQSPKQATARSPIAPAVVQTKDAPIEQENDHRVPRSFELDKIKVSQKQDKPKDVKKPDSKVPNGDHLLPTETQSSTPIEKESSTPTEEDSNASTPVPPKVQRRVLTIVSSKSNLKEELAKPPVPEATSPTNESNPMKDSDKIDQKKMKKKSSNTSLTKKPEAEPVVEVEPLLSRKTKKKKPVVNIPKKFNQQAKREMNANSAAKEPDGKTENAPATIDVLEKEMKKEPPTAEKEASPLIQTIEAQATANGIVFPGLPDPQIFSNLGVELSLLSTNIENLTQLSQTLSSLANSDGFIDPKTCEKCSTQASNKVSINFNGVENVIDPQEFIDQALGSVLSTAYVLRDGIISQMGQTIELEDLERSKRIQLSNAPMDISFDDLFNLFSKISQDIRVVWQNQSELIIEFSYPGEAAEAMARHLENSFKFQGKALALSMDQTSNLPIVFGGNTVETWTSSEWKEKLELVTEVIENVEGAKRCLNERRFNHVCPNGSPKASTVETPDISENEYLSKLFSSLRRRFASVPDTSNASGTATDQEHAKEFEPWEALATATGLDPSKLANLNPAQFSQLISSIQQEFPDPEALLNSLIDSQPAKVTFAEPDIYQRIAALESQLEVCKREEEEALTKLQAVRDQNNPDRLFYYEKMGIRKLPSETSEDEEWIDEED
ncbi:transcriptional repressor general negative regulator of transcription subunit 4 [Terramyces sp. JEL0728]|nr:transcriptional repressor general negative regulator of transcription subunit 4 [Terramyces sp. JEL0728]